MLQFFFENAWRWKCGLPEKENTQMPDLTELRITEWDIHFETLMRNRLIMGAIRYGRMRQKGKPQYNRVESMIKRLNKYNASGNMEILVDVANLCLLEFIECNHPTKHFHAMDEHADHLTIT